MNRFSSEFSPITVQIAGVKSLDEAKMLESLGTDILGFPLRLPINKEDTPEAEAKKIISELNVPACLICYLDNPVEIIELTSYLKVSIVQLHGPVKKSTLDYLRINAPELKIIKSLIIGKYSKENLQEIIEEQSSLIDAYITDTFDPQSGAEGATGKTHDWLLSKKLVSISPIPVLLAGGLDPNNVQSAIKAVNPFGVDAHTRIEDKFGNKDPRLCEAFISASKSNL